MNLDRIKSFLREQARAQLEQLRGNGPLTSPVPENDTLDQPGKLAYVAMNQQREQAARAYNEQNGYQPSAPLNWKPNYAALDRPEANQQPQTLGQRVGQTASASWDEFVKAAGRIAQESGYPLQVLLGQAALETGRGKSVPGNNFFGIKGQGTTGTQTLGTQEADSSGRLYQTTGGFGGYRTPDESIRAYIDLISKDPRYANAWKQRTNPARMLQEIKKAGYATDPDYVKKVSGTPEFRGAYGN